MNKDLISLIITIITSTLGVVTTIYHNPQVGIIVFSLGIIAYLGYVGFVTYKGIAGNSFIRLLPVLVLVTVGGIIYFFWPSTLQITIYADLNSSGYREEGEPGIKNEQIGVIDKGFTQKPLITNSNGMVSVGEIAKGEYYIRVRGFTIQGKARRGINNISIGFMAKNDNSPPQTRIFLGEELGYPTDETYARKIYAHLWFQDIESGVNEIEIDWGDGRGWTPVDKESPTLNYYIYKHEYKQIGKKTVKFKVKNGNGLSSFPSNEPPRPGRDFVVIDLKKIQSNIGVVP